MRRNWATLVQAVPDLRVDIERWAVDGTQVWTEVHVHGHRTDGSLLDVCGVTITTVDDGLITAGRIFLEEVERDRITI